MQPVQSQIDSICAVHGFSNPREVGRGNFKTTYQVQDQNGRLWAVKVFKQSTPDDRTDREIAAMSQCDDVTIAKLAFVDTIQTPTGNHFFLVEEFLAGGSLGDRLTFSGALTRDAILAVGARLIQALEHLAPRKLVHRDIKPDNVMFRDLGNDAVLVDFGVVRKLGDTSLTASWLAMGPGTPAFASPEQLQNDKPLIGGATDQFCLGLTLAYAVTLTHPFQMAGEGLADAIRRVASRDAIPLERAQELVNLGLPVLLRMMESWPVRRFRDPSELLREWEAQ